MSAILEFISSLLDGFQLLALAAAVGSVGYAVIILRPFRDDGAPWRRLLEQSLTLCIYAAAAVAILETVRLVLKPWALADEFGRWAFTEFTGTGLFHWGLVRMVLAGGLLATAVRLRRLPRSPQRWALVIAFALALLISGAWFSHAASRLDDIAALMTATILHELGAMLWVGGVINLLLAWRVKRRDETVAALWPELLARFSLLGIASITLIVGPGIYLASHYVAAWERLIGTGYGNMLMAKILFLLMILGFAAFNFLAARRWRRSGDASHLYKLVPPHVEAETGLAVALMLSAAALAALPPAVDVGNETATPAEIWAMVSPKIPHLSGPEKIWVPAPELTDLRTGEHRMKEHMQWSNFNHNIAGVLVILMALLALLDRSGRARWARHWPLLFFAFAVFIFVWADEQVWPVGHRGIVESLKDPEVFQHRMAGFVVLGLGIVEWRARNTAAAASRLPYIMPLLCAAGGILLLTHSHATFELKREFLIQSTHVSMGILAVVIACGRWLELRLPPPHDRVAGYVAVYAMLAVGILLLFYREP